MYAFVKEGWRLRKDMADRLEHAEQCAEWARNLKKARKEELDIIRQQRHADVRSRLIALGWGPELAILEAHRTYDIQNYPGVMEARKLTDRAWHEIKGPVVERLELVRDLVKQLKGREDDLLRALLFTAPSAPELSASNGRRTQTSETTPVVYKACIQVCIGTVHLQLFHVSAHRPDQVNLASLESEILYQTLGCPSVHDGVPHVHEEPVFELGVDVADPPSPQDDSLQSHSVSSTDVFTARKEYDCAYIYDNPIRRANPVTILALFMVVAVNIMGGVSRPLCNFILNCCIRILSLTMRDGHKGARSASSLTAYEERLLKEFPKDLRQVRNIFRLEPNNITYATCPRCSCLYPPIQPSSDTPKYSTTCTWRYPRYRKENTCGQVLVQFGAGRPFSVDKPIRPFAFRPLPDFISHLLSRSGLERRLEQPLAMNAEACVLEDLSQSPLISEALQRHQAEIRAPATDHPLYLVWGLCVDWFNPYGNKIAGTKQSAGMMALTCYNLPADIRYRTENMHLCGVIPGPKEPSREEMNHFLAPLVDDFLRMWDPGVYFSRTAKYEQGRRVFCLLVPLISDAPASKKISGMTSHSATLFCSLCRLPRADINNLDEQSWERITPEQHRQLADRWRQAESKAEQDRLLKQNGIRWSELLRLPYWDPTRFIIIDPMHNLLLGLIQFHCRVVLGFDVKQSAPEDCLSFTGRWSKGVDEAKLAEGRLLLAQASPTLSKLKELRLPNLLYLCRERHLWAVPGGKNGKLRINDLIEALLKPKYLKDYPEKPTENSVLLSSDLELPSHVDPTNFLTSELLAKIHRDMNTHLRPSWMKNLPRTFGSSSHGKLKADQWRTAMEFDLPMSLIEAWALREGSSHQSLIDNTMDLVLALQWATSPRISAFHVSRYMHHIKSYLEGLRRHISWIKLRPNHHYALHLGELMLRFGPTNSKPGHLEVTMMNTFCMAGNLRGFLSSSECPATLSECQELVDRYLTSFHELDHEPRAVTSEDEAKKRNEKTHKLDDQVYRALLSHLPPGSTVGPYASPLRHIVLDGVQYTTAHQSKRDSQVFFHATSNSIRAGYIREIFNIPRSSPAAEPHGSSACQTFVVICPYPEATIPACDNPFARYPDFKAIVCSKPRQGDIFVAPIRNIICHAGLHKTDGGNIVLKALERYIRTEAGA
ncbi:hypothetical protein NM688_g7934 [Phlebia brevispora]|uniref:Uncharacterized protein n=1 Tax=Phlebia brevispora TaxID=194682 RepID=A0ACC1RZI5_9APHY|nr:hypothetical protein NM688_g7934 [Phlebia brevispora]